MARQRTRSAWERAAYSVRVRLRLLAGDERILPDFLILGLPKCGTTSLYADLCRHPGVAPALRKEIYYFTGRFRNGERWYRAHFPRSAERDRALAAGRALVTGEATPNYFGNATARDRIRAALPDARFIVLFRSPAARAYSYHQHRSRRGVETRPFAEAVEAEGFGDSPTGPYLGGGLYARDLRPWLGQFPREQFLLLNAEAYFRAPEPTLERVHAFLGLPHCPAPAQPRLNAGAYPPADPALRQRLRDYFAPHNRDFFELIGEKWDWE
jgi:hypothetical protein